MPDFGKSFWKHQPFKPIGHSATVLFENVNSLSGEVLFTSVVCLLGDSFKYFIFSLFPICASTRILIDLYLISDICLFCLPRTVANEEDSESLPLRNS